MENNLRKITTISLQPGAVWAYSREHRKQLVDSLVSIASTADGSCEIFLTIEEDSTMIYVYRNGELAYEEAIVSDDDATATVGKLYVRFLAKAAGEDPEPEIPRETLEDDIYEREDELCSAMEDFLNVAVEGFFDAYFGYDADISQEIVDCVCRHLAEEYGVSVRWPRFEIGKDGSETYVEFPYEDLASGQPNEETQKSQEEEEEYGMYE